MITTKRMELIGMTLNEIIESTNDLGLPKYIPKEIALWVYQKGATTFEAMTNLSKPIRKTLNERFTINTNVPSKVSNSADGTKKYLFPVAGPGRFIETVYIPEEKRNTVCISSQVGCKLGCQFCMTARQGFQAQLSPAEIINQILGMPERLEITNIVFMGMGEPFDNTDNILKSLEILTAGYGLGYSAKKITVSTVGLIPGMKRFLSESDCHLAVSLHSPFDKERASLMPVQKVYPIGDVLETIRSFGLGRQRRVSFEYILFEGINDTSAHVNQMARLFNGLKCRVNLMRFHTIPNVPLRGASEEKLEQFRDKLNNKGIVATIRASRGRDILAACGLLSTKEQDRIHQSKE